MEYSVGPCVVITLTLQLFTWFSKRHVAIIFSLYYVAKACGHIVWIQLLSTDMVGVKYFVAGTVLALLGIADFWLFIYYPLEADIFVGVEGRSGEEAQKFKTY